MIFAFNLGLTVRAQLETSGYWDGRMSFLQARPSSLRASQPRVLIDADGRLIVTASQLSMAPFDSVSMMRWDGRGWTPLAGTIDVAVLALHQRDVIAAGRFDVVEGVAATNIARWNGAQWSALGTGLNGRVLALLAREGDLLAGGEFTAGGADALQHIARWNGASWQPLGEGLPTPVQALAANGDVIYAATSNPVDVYEWRNARWRSLAGAGFSAVNGGIPPLSVRSLAFHEGSLFVAGGFSAVDGVPIRDVAEWRDGVWKQPGQPIVTSAPGLMVANGGLHLYGYIWTNFPEGAPLMRLEAGRWIPVPAEHVSDVVSMATRGSEMFLVARVVDFALGMTAANYGFFQFDGTQWHLLNNGLPFTPMERPFFRVVAGREGVVLNLTSTTTSPIRAPLIWDGGRYRPTTVTNDPGTGTLNIEREFVRLGDHVFAHASWFPPNQARTNVLVRLDDGKWSPATGPMEIAVTALAGGTGRILAAGRDESRAGVVGGASEWDGTAWTRLTGDFLGPGPAGFITAAARFHNEWFVGGSFTNIGGRDLPYLARWTGAAWETAGTFDGPVTGLAVGGEERLFVVGKFRHVGDLAAAGVAVWDGANWTTLGTGLPGALINWLSVSEDGLVAVVGNIPLPGGDVSNVMIWRRDRWDPPGGSAAVVAPGIIRACVWRGHDLHLAGDFLMVNGRESPGLAIWHEPGVSLKHPDLTGDHFEMSITGALPDRFRLETSPDLTRWTGAFTNGLGHPSMKFRVPMEEAPRFHRLRSLPPE
jgi:hypothetical protein